VKVKPGVAGVAAGAGATPAAATGAGAGAGAGAGRGAWAKAGTLAPSKRDNRIDGWLIFTWFPLRWQ